MVLTGSGSLLGNWNPAKGHTLTCHHEKELLVWEVSQGRPALCSVTWIASIVIS